MLKRAFSFSLIIIAFISLALYVSGFETFFVRDQYGYIVGGSDFLKFTIRTFNDSFSTLRKFTIPKINIEGIKEYSNTAGFGLRAVVGMLEFLVSIVNVLSMILNIIAYLIYFVLSVDYVFLAIFNRYGLEPLFGSSGV